MPSNNRINFQVGFNVDQSSINAVKKSLQDLQNIRPKDFSGTKDDLNQIRQMAGKVQTALDRAFNVNLGSLNTQKFNAELSTANLSVDKIYQTFSKAGAQGQVAFSKMASSVLTTNMQLKQTRGLISQMGQTMMNTVKWGIASSVMNTFTNSVQQAFQYVKSLDSALTDIRIVTGDSTQQMAKFADQANRAASQLGRSTMDYSKAALSFYQQGLDDEAVQARTEAVLKAENITGAGDQMADYMTAVWNGYKVANEQAELYVDKLAAVADSSASNMSQLAVAMSKVASTANTMGVDVDSLNAQIATIVATTRQAPQSVGNALKTIYTRINDIATGADDAQISLGNYSEKMAEVGINVLDTNGRLRDTQDVIEQVGQKWAGMSKEQQIYLARTMAGQRQINNLTALFDNWGKYIDLVDVSMNSQGATMQKNSRYMESLEAHINQLGAANQRLKTAMIDSNSFKGLIDLGTGAVTILSNFIQSIGGGGNALLAFGSIATQVFSGTIAKQINNVVTHFQTLKSNAELVKQDIANIKLFGTSEGYQDGTIKAMVDAKAAAAQYYNFMDAAQKNQYNEIVKRVGATQDQVTLLNEKIKKANEFQSALKGQLDTTIEVKDQLQNMLNSLSSKQGGLQLLGTKDQQGNLVYLEELKTKVNQLRNTVDSSAIPGFKAFDEAISKIGQNSEITVPQLAAVRRALAQIVSETNVGIDLSLGIKELETEAKQAQASLQLAKQAAQDYLNSVKQFANIQGIVKATGALGGFASSLMAIKNLGKVWSNQTLSGGEKVLQTMISLGTAGPRLVTTFLELRKITSAWSTALDLTNKIQTANAAITKSQILVQKAHVEVQTLEAAAQNIKNNANITEIQRTSALTIVEGKLAEARKEETIALMQEKAAQEGLNKALASNPIGLAMAITAAAIFIGVKAYDALTMSAKEAEQAVEAFNQKQQSLNNNLKKFNTDKTNLNIDEWDELSKRAGAYNSTINNLTEQQKTRYYELSNLIAEYNQSAVAGYDEQGNAIIETNHNLEETIQLLKQKRQSEIDNTYDSKEYKQNVRAQQVQYKDTEKEYQNRKIDNQNIDLNQQNAFNQNLDYLKQRLIDSGDNYSDLINEINQIQKQGLDNFNKNKDIFIADLNKASSVVPKAAIDYFTNIGDQLKEGKKQQEEIAKELQEASKIDFSTLLGKLSTTQNKQQYQAAKQAGALSIDGLIQSYIDGLIESGQVSRAKLGQQEDIYQYIIDEFLNSSEGFLTKLNEALYTQSSNFGFDQQHNPLNLQQYILQISNDLEQQDFSNLQEKQKAIVEKIKQILLNNEELQAIFADDSKENAGLRQAILQFFSNAFNLDGLEINFDANDKLKDIKVSNEGVNKLKNRIEQTINENVGDQKFKVNVQQLEALLPDDITTGEIDALIPIFERLYQVTGNWEEALRKAQQQLDFSNITNTAGLLSRQMSGEQLDDKETAALQQSLNQLQQSFPQVQDAIDAVVNKWAVGSQQYRKAASLIQDALLHNVKDSIEEVQRAGDQVNANAMKESFQNSITTVDQALDAFEIGLLQLGDKIPEGLAKTSSSLFQLAQLLNYGAISGQQFASALREVSDTEVSNLGLDVDKYQDYVQLLQITNQKYQENEYLARQVAKANMQIEKGTQDLIDSWDDWNETIEDYLSSGRDVLTLANNWGQLKEAIANTLAINPQTVDLLGPDFVADNWQKIQAVKDGVEGAWEQLDATIGQTIQMDVLANVNDDALQSQLLYDFDLLDQFKNQDFTVIADMDNSRLIAAATEIVDTARWSSDQAQAAFSQMGYDIQVEGTDPTKHTTSEQTQYYVPPTYSIETVSAGMGMFGQPISIPIVTMTSEGRYQSAGTGVKETYEPGHYAIKAMTPNGRSSGGGVSRKVANRPSNSSGGNGGRGGKGGHGGKGKKAAAPKPGTKAKTVHNKIDTKEKQKQYNPYQQVEKSYQRQQKSLKKLQQAEKKITGKQRLKNLNAQIKALQEQNKIIEERQKISDDAASEGSTADLRRDITKDKVLGADKNLFDEDGKIRDQTAMRNRMVDDFNSDVKGFADTYEEAEKQYNKWIKNTWNKYNKDEQEKHKAQKDRHDEQLKDAKQLYDKQVKEAEELYKKRGQLIDDYQKKLEQDIKYQQQYFDNLRTIFDKGLQGITVKAKIDLDAGDALRTWNQFDNRVLRQIDKNDILGNSKAKAREIKTYLDSGQIKTALNTAKNLRDRLANIESGGYDVEFGIDHDAWAKLSADQKALYTSEAKEKIRAQLEELIKNTEDGLLKVQDLLEDLEEDYVDSLKQAGDRMDDLIDQYERVNDLLDHQIKVNELLYGEQAYKYLNKFYEKQRQNNQQQLANLHTQQKYWQQQLNAHQDANGKIINEQAWKEAKANLDKITDNMNSKLEEMMQNAAKVFENKMLQATEKVNNRLTNGLGTKYLDEQWDQIGQFDDYFLDAVNSKFGIQDVTRAYQQAAATVNDPRQQQKINKLMNDQLKILKEKDKLTEYDIERAKASLQVEKARMALEDARNNKTKMRLRRDSQGNYTYQYVADEQKLTDLQAALEDAQNNLYNQDKQHYKQNLNQLYSTYKEYIEKMTALQKEYNQTEDEFRKAQIEKQKEYLMQSIANKMDGLTEDNKVTLETYLRGSTFDAMGWNLSDYTDEQSLALTRQIVPWGNSEIQDLANNIVGEGGLLNATRDFLSELTQASQQYDTEIKSAMDTFTDVQSKDMQQAINNTNNSLDQQNKKANALINTYKGLTNVAKDAVKDVAVLVEGMQKLLDNNLHLDQMGQSLKELTNVNLNQMGSSVRVQTPTAQQQKAEYNAVTNLKDQGNYTGSNQLYQAWINSDVDHLDKDFENAFKLQQQRKQKQAEQAARKKAKEQAERKERQAYQVAKKAEEEAFKMQQEAQKRKQEAEKEQQERLKAMQQDMANQAMEQYLRDQNNQQKANSNVVLNRLSNLNDGYAKAAGAGGGGKGSSSNVNNTYNIDANFPNATSGEEVVQAVLNLPNIAAQKVHGTGS